MILPETAIEAAATSIYEDGDRISNGDAYDLASNALEAALPEIEAAIRSEWADYIDSATITVGNTLTLESLADILRQPGRPFGTEKGTTK